MAAVIAEEQKIDKKDLSVLEDVLLGAVRVKMNDNSSILFQEALCTRLNTILRS